MKEKLQQLFFIVGFRDYFFVFIILIAFMLRMNGFEYPYYPEDTSRDYLIAHHIIAYHEFPLNGHSGQLPNSPFYWYLIAAFLLIKDNFLFLNYLNIGLQLVFLWGIYIVSRNLFGTTSARIAALLVAVSQTIIQQSFFIWTPHVMQVFLMMSFVCLSFAYRMRSYIFLLAGVALFIVSVLIHNSAFALFLMLIAMTIFTFVRMRRSLTYTIARLALLFLVVLNMVLLAYLPLFFENPHNTSNGPSSYRMFSRAPSLFGTPLRDVMYQNSERAVMFLQSIFIALRGFSLIVISSLLAGCLIAYWYRVPKGSEQKKYILFLTACVIQFFFIIPLIHTPGMAFPLRYFTPLFGIFFIITAEMIRGAFLGDSPRPSHTASLIIVIGFVMASVMDSSLFVSRLSGLPKTTLYLRGLATAITLRGDAHDEASPPVFDGILRNIREIQEREHRSEPNFFQFDSYVEGRQNPYVEGVFWRLLEEEMRIKLVAIDNADVRGFHPLTTDDYIFLICRYTGEQEETYKECLSGFFAHRPEYSVEKNIYIGSPYSVFLAKKISRTTLAGK